MASIAKLAVILSAVTKPLENDLKGAHSKLDSFAHSATHLGKLFTGLFVMDSIEKGFKKAIKANEELNECAEKAEGSFGRILVSITNMAHWLPIVANEVSKVADNIEQGFTFQELKETAIWWFEYSKRLNSENADAAMKLSREEFIKHKLAETAAERLKKLEEEKAQAAREAAWIQTAGTEEQEALLKELDNKYQSLLSDAQKLAMVRDAAPGSAKMGLIDWRMGQIAELEAAKKAEEDLKKVMDDGKSLTESMLTPLEKLVAEQAKYNEMLNKGAINTDTYNRAVKALTPGLKDLESIRNEIYKMEKGELAAKVKELREAGASEVISEYKKEYARLQKLKEMEELKKEMEKEFESVGFGADQQRESPQFASADQAGSAAAYSAILRAQAGQQGNDSLNMQKKQFDIEFKQFQILQQISKQQGDAIEAAGPGIRLIRMNIGGGNS